jgi:hypothetical protein
MKEGPEFLPDLRRQNALEVLDRRPTKAPILGLKAAERDVKRLTRQHQRKERDNVRKTLLGSGRDFPKDQRLDPGSVDDNPRVSVADGHQRSRCVDADVELWIVEGEHEAIDRTL